MLTFARLLTVLWFLALSLSYVQANEAEARDPVVLRIDPLVHDGKLEINADVRFDLNQTLREAAERGIPLHFTADLVIARSQWWWFEETLVDTSITWRIMYNALTRQWSAGSSELSLPVASLDEAMDTLRHIRNWRVAEVGELSSDKEYRGKLRVRLDSSLLPRPFQVNALNSSSWAPTTPWAPFTFSLAIQD
jgi:Domain of unknown function (DUF4390)